MRAFSTDFFSVRRFLHILANEVKNRGHITEIDWHQLGENFQNNEIESYDFQR